MSDLLGRMYRTWEFVKRGMEQNGLPEPLGVGNIRGRSTIEFADMEDLMLWMQSAHVVKWRIITGSEHDANEPSRGAMMVVAARVWEPLPYGPALTVVVQCALPAHTRPTPFKRNEDFTQPLMIQ